MWSFLFFECQLEIQHQQRERHDDGICKDHWKIISDNAVNQPNADIGNENQNHPHRQIPN